jgi:transposase-like protein
MEPMPPKARERWPDAIRQEALAIAADESYGAASEATGVPASTIRVWATRAHQAVKATGVAVVIPEGATWSEKRDLLCEAALAGASEAASACRQAILEERARDARDLSVCFAVLTDKHLLLGGFATSRHESWSVTAHVDPEQRRRETDEEVAKLKAETAELERELAELEAGDDVGA